MLINRPHKEEVLNAIAQEAEFNFDRNVHSNNIYATGVEELLVRSVTAPKFTFTSPAWQQMLNKIRVPKQFFDRCPLSIQENIFNHFVGQYDKEFLLRCRHTEDVGLHIRAVLSDRYGIVDNHQVFPRVFEALGDTEYAIRCFTADDYITELHLDFTDCTVTHNNQVYTAGLIVTNSETGHSSIWTEPVVHGFGLTFADRSILKRQGVDCRIVHRGNLDMERIAASITQYRDIAQVGIVQVLEAHQEMISRDHALRFIENIQGFSKKFVGVLEANWAEVEDLSRMEVARQIMEAASELPLFQRTQVVQQASRITGIFKNYRSRMQSILEEIS